MLAAGLNSYLRVEDAGGKVLAEDNDSGGNLDALIMFKPAQTASYRIVATSFQPNQFGSFRLTVREAVGAIVQKPPPLDPVKPMPPMPLPVEVKKPPAGWKCFVAKDQSFAVWLPENVGPTSEKERKIAQGNYSFTLRTVTAATADVRYEAGILEASPSSLAKPTKARGFEMVRNFLAEGDKLQIHTARGVRLGQMSGLEYVLEAGGRFVKARVFDQGTRFHVAAAFGTRQFVESANTGIFLESYEGSARAATDSSTQANPPLTKIDPAQPVDPAKLAARTTGENLGEAGRTVGSLTVKNVRWKAEGSPASLCWAADGKSFYCVEDSGILRRIKAGDLTEELQLDAGFRCQWLALSKEGLLLTLASRQEVWLLDADTFKLKNRFQVASVERAVSAPNLSIAVAVGKDSATVLDLVKGTAREYSSRDFDQRAGFRHAAVSPDGKYLFTQGGIEQLQRFRIDGTTLTFEDSSGRIASNGQGIAVSGDSKWVCLPAGGGNGGAPYCTHIFALTDLAQPALIIQQGAYPRAVAFDVKASKIYSQNHDHQLVIFDSGGRKLQEYALSPRGDQTRQILAHPDGERALVLTGNQLFWVEVGR